MIVKVQISLGNSNKRVLVYNEDQSVMYEDKASKEILKKMKGRDKVYFKAHTETIKDLEKKIKGFPKIIVLDEIVKDQNW